MPKYFLNLRIYGLLIFVRQRLMMKRPYERLASGFESHVFLGSGNDYGLRVGDHYACHITQLAGSARISLTLFDLTDMVIIHYSNLPEFAAEWTRAALCSATKQEVQE